MMDQIKEIEKFISDYVNSAHSKGVVLGMSGGKDSLICAKLCSNALGKDKVVGIIMPNGEMKDINIAIESCKLLGIRYYNLNINDLYNIYLQLIKPVLKDQSVDISSVTTINLPPRLRAICLYALAGSLNYLVVNTSNLSEKEVGKFKVLVITLKYDETHKPVISNLKRISKTGLRVYSKAKDLPQVFGGLGIAIISTSKGLMTDRKARKENLGGEVLCYVW